MLGFSLLSVLKSIFYKESQPVGYMHHVSCFYDVCHIALQFTFLVLCHCWHIFISRM